MKTEFWMVILSFLAFDAYCQNKTIEVKYISTDIIIDGKQDDWPEMDLVIPGGGNFPYTNKNMAAIAWDEQNLFVIFSIEDKNLCMHESGNNNPRLYLNDGIEIYIDTKGDSGKKMDNNDYQILISIPNTYTVFKGDKFLIREGYQVPKDFENHTLILDKAVTVSGTINDITDYDKGYVAEAAIPWQSLGIKPYTGYALKLDLCVNDVDTLVDMRSMPDDWHPISINTINYQGKTEYGYPEYWTDAVLTGKPGLGVALKNIIQKHWQFAYSLFLIILGIAGWIIYRQFKKIRFYQTFPSRSQLQQLDSESQRTGVFDVPNNNHKQIEKTNIPDQITEIKKFIDANIQKDISLHDLCQHIHLGDRHLQRLCRQYCGLSPIQLVNTMKLEAAEKLLTETNLTINEIAFHFGYDDAGYFSNLFKKYYGTSPVAYRKNKKNS